MVAISRVRALFSGSAVQGPAMSSVFTTGDPVNTQAPWAAFWDSLRPMLPPSLTITIPNTGETYEDSTGALTEVWTDGVVGSMVGTSGIPEYARGVGARVVWNTNGTTNNRRVRGSTFIVPIAISSFDVDGTLKTTTRSLLTASVNTFVAATTTDLTIWTRPINGTGGKSSGVTAGAVPDSVSTLRSRRV